MTELRRLLSRPGPVLVATVGPPGAGKTTWRRRECPQLPVVSLDACRALVSPYADESDQDPSTTANALNLARASTADLLRSGLSVLWDATNCRPGHRRALLGLAAEHRAATAAAVILPDLRTCLDRNAARPAEPGPCGYARRVPEEVITDMHGSLVADMHALHTEGWDLIVCLDRSGLSDTARP